MIAGLGAKALGFGIAAGAWGATLTFGPACLVLAVAISPAARLRACLEIEAEAFARAFGDQLALARRREAERRAA